MRRMAMQILHDDDLAADAVQETLTRLWHRRWRLDLTKNPQGFSMNALRNECIDTLRHQRSRNTLAADPDERKQWMDYAVRQLRMADAIGAACCVNVVGTPYGPRWDGGYRENFSRELWEMAVAMIRQIIDTARPKHTKFCIESMPWMIPSSPDEYMHLIEDVDRAEFGTHLDVVNMITTPRRYFFNDEFLRECFDKLHGTIVSCHLKDILLKPEYTFQLQECACGEGTLDIGLYARLASAENPRMPMIIEHLSSDDEYVTSVKYIQQLIHKKQN